MPLQQNIDDASELLHGCLPECARRVEATDPVLAAEIRRCTLELSNKIAAIKLELQLIDMNLLSNEKDIKK